MERFPSRASWTSLWGRGKFCNIYESYNLIAPVPAASSPWVSQHEGGVSKSVFISSKRFVNELFKPERWQIILWLGSLSRTTTTHCTEQHLSAKFLWRYFRSKHVSSAERRQTRASRPSKLRSQQRQQARVLFCRITIVSQRPHVSRDYYESTLNTATLTTVVPYHFELPEKASAELRIWEAYVEPLRTHLQL